jgi:hypothetical protein
MTRVTKKFIGRSLIGSLRLEGLKFEGVPRYKEPKSGRRSHRGIHPA